MVAVGLKRGEVACVTKVGEGDIRKGIQEEGRDGHVEREDRG